MGSKPNESRIENTDLEIHTASTMDVDLFKGLLRKADLLEIDAGAGQTAEEALSEGLETSNPCFAAYWKGEPLCMFGVVPQNTPGDPVQNGSIWMVGTDLVDEMGMAFLRVSRQWFDQLMKQYDTLGNAVDARNEVHIKWLKWLGFDFLAPVPMGPYNLPFIPFYRCNVVHV